MYERNISSHFKDVLNKLELSHYDTTPDIKSLNENKPMH